LNPLLKKPKSCCTCSLVLGTCLFLAPGLPLYAADISSPPAAGSQTRDEQVEAPPSPPELPGEAKSPASQSHNKQQPAQAQAPGLPSDAPASDDSRNLPQPDVRIIHEQDKTVEEYRIGGKLRYVKITPSKGKPYYLVDRDGDGTLETRYSDLKGPPPINQWLLLEW
jgi:Protein of unknown function (DUF2782)